MNEKAPMKWKIFLSLYFQTIATHILMEKIHFLTRFKESSDRKIPGRTFLYVSFGG